MIGYHYIFLALGVALLGVIAGPSVAKNLGPLNIDGAGQQVYLVAPDWAVGNVQVTR